MANFFADWDTKTVAILHDAIEDPSKYKHEAPRKVTERSLRITSFPEHVITGVVAMTKPPDEKNYPRYLRKQVLPNLLARRVKAADNYVNLRDAIGSWTQDDDAFYRVNKYVNSLYLLKRGYRIR